MVKFSHRERASFFACSGCSGYSGPKHCCSRLSSTGMPRASALARAAYLGVVVVVVVVVVGSR